MYMLLWMPGRTTPIGLFNYYIMIDTIISIVLIVVRIFPIASTLRGSLPPFCKVLIIVIGPKITEMDMLKVLLILFHYKI